MTTLAPNLSNGFVHKGRIIYAVAYWLETPPPCSRNLIVWLTPTGDCQTAGIVHSDPPRRIVTTKLGEQIFVRDQLETVTAVNVYRASSLEPTGLTGGKPPF